MYRHAVYHKEPHVDSFSIPPISHAIPHFLQFINAPLCFEKSSSVVHRTGMRCIKRTDRKHYGVWLGQHSILHTPCRLSFYFPNFTCSPPISSFHPPPCVLKRLPVWCTGRSCTPVSLLRSNWSRNGSRRCSRHHHPPLLGFPSSKVSDGVVVLCWRLAHPVHEKRFMHGKAKPSRKQGQARKNEAKHSLEAGVFCSPSKIR